MHIICVSLLYPISHAILRLKPVAARPKALVCGRSLPGIAGSNSVGRMDVCYEGWLLSGRGLCTGRSVVQMGVTECDVSVCDRRNSQGWPRLTMGCRTIIKRITREAVWSLEVILGGKNRHFAVVLLKVNSFNLRSYR